MSTKVKRSNVATFINVNPTGTANYQLAGDGITTAIINYNPKTNEEQYISQDTATITLDSYAPAFPMEMTAVEGDNVFEYVEALRKARSVGSDAETQIVNVWKYETLISGSMYPAEKQTVSVAIENFGGDGGKNVQLKFSLNYQGNQTLGHFHVASGTFLAGSPAN
jgi:hypothetical protein